MLDRFRRRQVAFLLLACLFATRVGEARESAEEATAADNLAFFEEKVRPLLIARCEECHGADQQEGKLRLDLKAGWEKGGESGPAVIPGRPEKSLLMKAVSYGEKDLQMPPDEQLPAAEIETLRQWITRGAADPRDGLPPAHTAVSDEWSQEFTKRLQWWSLQPLRDVVPPQPADLAWCRDPIDQFVMQKLSGVGLKPSPTAEHELLLRRLCFVLTGLPPTVEQRAQFLEAWQARGDQAVEALVDRLLASPHFGERFARHWMDVVRYTDTYGYEWDNPAKGSWEYRDYLTRAFNHDLPYDQFVREQLAGDMLPAPRINATLRTQENLIAPMFYHFGEHRHGSSLEFNGVHQEMIHNKIDALSKTFLATTVACARCHNHKLEAVSQRDYYALAAVLMNANWTSRVVDAPQKNAEAIEQLKQLRAQIRNKLAEAWLAAAGAENEWSDEKLLSIMSQAPSPGPQLGEVAYPLARLLAVKDDAVKLASTWQAIRKEWHTQHQERVAKNQIYRPLGNLAQAQLPEGWIAEGDGLAHGYVSEAELLVALGGDRVVDRLLPRGFHTHALSSKLPGALRLPPQHEIAGNIVSIQLAGGEFGGYLIKHGNAFQGEQVTFLNSPLLEWRSFGAVPLKNGVTKVTVELATAPLNSNFPPRTGLAPGLPHNDFGYDKRSWLSITEIVAHDGEGPPADTLDVYRGLYEGEPPKTAAELAAKLRTWLFGSLRRWQDGSTQAGDSRLLNWAIKANLLSNQIDSASDLGTLVSEYRRIEATIEFPRTANSMDEPRGQPSPYPLNVRGNVDVLGELVTPGFLTMFAARSSHKEPSSRLEIAESLLEPDHPLTTRVYVNRVWQWVFGTGLVATPDDFGRLGEQPSHPELLDYLARDFQREGWSTKKLIRRLVLSATFRQSGRVSSEARQVDPSNRLLHHYATRRLEAEAIRDNLLAVSGRLERSLYGRPIPPPRTAEDTQKRLFSGPLDGLGRRSSYLQMSIMEPPKFLAGFNLPDLKLPSGRRDTASSPAQSLLLLNDPMVSQLAGVWADRLLHEQHRTVEERLKQMFVEAFGRLPSQQETARWQAALADFAEGDQNLLGNQAAWQHLAHTLFNAKEFLHYR
jgi:cytochrome c553